MNSFAAALRRGFATGGCRTFATIASQQLRCTTTTNIDVHRRYHGASSENTRPTQLIQHSHYGQSLGSYVNYFIVQRRPRQLLCIATNIRPWHNVCHQKRKTRVVTHGPNWKRRRQVGHRRLGVLIPMTNRIGHLIAWVYVAYYFEKNWFLYKLIISILVHVYHHTYCQLRCSFGGK